ncbi:hypothetical protein BJG93_36480 (plasmid) [Paraburkholderia sprentiae WSM5005]|uniref:Uncharacterized protein n=1 Tax=Paraburkholderia sprentiae WSM5005 TaxID=754502 RepID=A0A8F4KJW8_9BURK|nr:hypothetical protein [Paraburkholderia sprentiae]QXE07326.1 hypothetical protein BJG93_36480 [Paraburkholderia sprentiae WSM5005]
MSGLICRFKCVVPRANALMTPGTTCTAVRHRDRRMNEHRMKFILMNVE